MEGWSPPVAGQADDTLLLTSQLSQHPASILYYFINFLSPYLVLELYH